MAQYTGGPDRPGPDPLRARADEHAPLTGLTDAELAVATPSDARSLVPRPWLSSLDAAVRDAVLDAARRSLIARGDVVADEDGTLHRGPVLDELLRIRSTSDVVLLAEQQTADRVQFAALYAGSEDVTVVEQSDPAGIHRFWSMPEKDALRRLLFWAAPTATSEPVDPDSRTIPVAEWEASASSLLAGTTRTTAIVRVDGDGESPTRRLSVYERPGGPALLRPVGPDTLELSVVDLATLSDAVAALLDRS